MHTIRQTSGLAGFPKRDESAHDAFGVGHSSTSISAGLGMFTKLDLVHSDPYSIFQTVWTCFDYGLLQLPPQVWL